MSADDKQDIQVQPSSQDAKVALKRHLDSLIGQWIVVGLVLVDYLFSMFALILAIYDPSIDGEEAASPFIPQARNLTATYSTWSSLRVALFSISMIIRLLFALEVGLRISIEKKPLEYFRSVGSCVDFFFILVAIITKPALMSRESLVISPWILLPRLWRLKLVHQADVGRVQNIYEDRLEGQRLAYENSKERETLLNQELTHKVQMYEQKLGALTGEHGIMIDENQLNFYDLYRVHEQTPALSSS